MNKKRVIIFWSVMFVVYIFPIVFAFLTMEPGYEPMLSIFKLYFAVLGIFSSYFLLYLIYNVRKDKLKFSKKQKALDDDFKDKTDEERDELAWRILTDMYSKLPATTLEDGTAGFLIKTGKDARFLKRTLEYIAEKIQPTDTAVWEQMKGNADYHNSMMERTFVGSTTVRIVSMIALPIGLVYNYTCKRPYYLSANDGEQESSFWSSAIAGTWGTRTKSGVEHYDIQDGHVSRNHLREAGDSILYSIVGLVFKIGITLFWLAMGIVLAPVISLFQFRNNYKDNLLSPFKDQTQWFQNEYGALYLESEKAEEVLVA